MINKVATLIRKSRGLNYQTRWNMYPRTRKESISEHTFNVAMFTTAILAIKNKGVLSYVDYETIVGSLFHDMEESVSGDIPTLTKRLMGNELGMLEESKNEMMLNKIPSFEYLFKFFRNNRVVELADKLAAMWFAAEQEECGIQIFRHIKNQIVTKIINDYSEVFPQVKEFISALGIKYEREEYTNKFTHVGEYYDDKKSGAVDSGSGAVDGKHTK
nr:MAG TPA: putative hydrolase of HD superfamily [Bacteriophage sp.]